MATPPPRAQPLHRSAPVRPALTATLALVLAAFLFGTTFLVVQDAVGKVEVIPFLAARFLIGALALAPMVARLRSPAAAVDRPAGGVLRGGVLRAGLAAGGALIAGYLLQTYGLRHTTSSVSAFITYLLVVFVPILAAVVLRRPPRLATVAGVGLATAGLVLLTGGMAGVGRGELLTLGCAWAFAVHIVLLATFAPRFDTIQFTLVQLATVGGALALPGLFAGGYRFPPEVWLAAAYTGVVVTAGGFVLQVWAQRVVGPSRTALILLLEPVFAAVLGYVAGERLGIGGAFGAGLILAGILLSESGGLLTRQSAVGEGDTPPTFGCENVSQRHKNAPKR